MMVTMVLMLVITLIVLGFAQVSRRELRQSLDRQLSAQAFMAAESGVNDARHALARTLADGREVQDKTECETSPTPANAASNPYAANPVIDADNDIAYTCLLVTTKAEDIFQPVSADCTSSVIPLRPETGAIGTININWQLSERPAAISSCPAAVPASGSFPNSGSWACPYGVLRIDLVPIDTNVLKRGDLMANQRAAFLYPTRAVGSPTLDYATARGRVAPMSCTLDGCSIRITGVSGSNDYAMRVSAIYNAGNLTVTADDSSGNPLTLTGAQAVVDSTGKAQDVLRRVQVRFFIIPAGDNANGNYALQSVSSICKRFSVITGANTFSIPGDIQGQDNVNNPMCKSGTYNPAP